MNEDKFDVMGTGMSIEETMIAFNAACEEVEILERKLADLEEDIDRNILRCSKICVAMTEDPITEEMYEGLLRQYKLERTCLHDRIERAKEDMSLLLWELDNCYL